METNPSNPVADAALVEAAQLGDERAFAVLYRRYHQDIRALCSKTLRDPDTAEDLAQETFLRALDHIDDFEPGRPVWPWLATIARHLCVDEIRGIARRNAMGRSVSQDTEGVDVTSEEAIDRVERQRLRGVVRGALAGLRPRDRRVFVLQTMMGWSQEQIAQNNQISVHAVRNLAWRARRALRRSLNGERTWGLIFAFRLRWKRRPPSGSGPARFDMHGVVVERIAAIVLGVAAVAGATVFSGFEPALSRPASLDGAASVEQGAGPEVDPDRRVAADAARSDPDVRVLRRGLVEASVGTASPRNDAAAPSKIAAHIAIRTPDGETVLVHEHDATCGGHGEQILPPDGPVAVVC